MMCSRACEGAAVAELRSGPRLAPAMLAVLFGAALLSTPGLPMLGTIMCTEFAASARLAMPQLSGMNRTPEPAERRWERARRKIYGYCKYTLQMQ